MDHPVSLRCVQVLIQWLLPGGADAPRCMSAWTLDLQPIRHQFHCGKCTRELERINRLIRPHALPRASTRNNVITLRASSAPLTAIS